MPGPGDGEKRATTGVGIVLDGSILDGECGWVLTGC